MLISQLRARAINISNASRATAGRSLIRSTIKHRSTTSRPLCTGSIRPLISSCQRRPCPAFFRSGYGLRHVSMEAPAKSTEAPTKKRRTLIARTVISALAFTGAFAITAAGLVLSFFVYDASTYNTDAVVEDVSVSNLALHPKTGGPKNLPIIDIMIDDDDSESKVRQRDKPRLVVLGTGWGSVAMLKTLNAGDYHVTVVSPENYFLFTPMLPSATVGTLGLRSLVEPIRRVLWPIQGHFIRAKALDVEVDDRLVEVSQVGPDGESQHFYLPYDRLVIGVGSTSNPHGVKGLECCNFLKSIDDARQIKRKIITNLEKACLPTTSDEERKRLLSFVVCGGGPTGVEFAAELYDMLNEDLLRSFPKILRNEISVHLIQSRRHILNTYDEALSIYAEQRFAHDQVNVLTNSRVEEVYPDKIIFCQSKPDGTKATMEIPMGFCLWSTGVSQNELCQKLSKKLKGQNNVHALETDTYCRVSGSPGDIYAIGDCSTVQNNITDHLLSFLRNIAWEKGQDPEKVQLTFQEWQNVASHVRHRFPQASQHLRRLDRLFQQYDKDHSGTLDFYELRELLQQIDTKLTSLPATAQRANQQGQYLGRKFSKIAAALPDLRAGQMSGAAVRDEDYHCAFHYKHLGSLAYIGNAAVFDFNQKSFAGGLLAVYLWRSIYFAQSVSLRTRIMLASDWGHRALFGRDLMDF